MTTPRRRWGRPAAEADWAGKYSWWGVAAVDTGDFVLATLPPTGAGLTWGDAASPFDLSRFDVLVLPEASSAYTDAEADAIAAFVQAGGGLFLVGNHQGADRDNNGVDAVAAYNALLTRWGGGSLEDTPPGLWFDAVDYDAAKALDAASGQSAAERPAGAPSHPVLDGPVGAVSRLGMYVGTTLSLAPGGDAVGLLWPLTPTDPTLGAYLAATTWGRGRLLALGDSALLGDATDSHGGRFGDDAIAEAGNDNLAFALNALYWLAGR